MNNSTIANTSTGIGMMNSAISFMSKVAMLADVLALHVHGRDVYGLAGVQGTDAQGREREGREELLHNGVPVHTGRVSLAIADCDDVATRPRSDIGTRCPPQLGLERPDKELEGLERTPEAPLLMRVLPTPPPLPPERSARRALQAVGHRATAEAPHEGHPASLSLEPKWLRHTHTHTNSPFSFAQDQGTSL